MTSSISPHPEPVEGRTSSIQTPIPRSAGVGLSTIKPGSAPLKAREPLHRTPQTITHTVGHGSSWGPGLAGKTHHQTRIFRPDGYTAPKLGNHPLADCSTTGNQSRLAEHGLERLCVNPAFNGKTDRRPRIKVLSIRHRIAKSARLVPALRAAGPPRRWLVPAQLPCLPLPAREETLREARSPCPRGALPNAS